MYAVAKRAGGRRFIHSVCGDFSFPGATIYQSGDFAEDVNPTRLRFAFHPAGGIRKCAARHCEARWIFQFDLTIFFYDVTEIDVFRIFHGLGYRALLAFSSSLRLCTTTHLPSRSKTTFLAFDQIRREKPFGNISTGKTLLRISRRHPHILNGQALLVFCRRVPHTSPMLSNLAAKKTLLIWMIRTQTNMP